MKKESCCVFLACFAICPKDVIMMDLDDEEFDYPEIIDEKCIRCYQCIKKLMGPGPGNKVKATIKCTKIRCPRSEQASNE